MNEPTFLERLMMIVRTVVSIVTWVIAIIIKIVGGLLPGGPKQAADRPQVPSPTDRSSVS